MGLQEPLDTYRLHDFTWRCTDRGKRRQVISARGYFLFVELCLLLKLCFELYTLSI